MSTITISYTGTVDLDGLVTTEAATFVCDVQSVSQQTKDLTNSYAVVCQAQAAFYLIENVGDDSIVVQATTSTGYIVFGLQAGAHAFLPGTAGDDGAITLDNIDSISARSVTSAGSRVVVLAGLMSENE